MLTVLGGLAEFERELIMARTGEGRLRAKARGVRFGRPRSLTAASAAGGYAASRGWRGAGRSREVLRRDPVNHSAGYRVIALSGQARSAREEHEVKETCSL
jgi:DNA invertase Pin-like site-specific DNA recombinase